MRKNKKIILGAFFIYVTLFVLPNGARAAILDFDPKTVTGKVGSTFTVNLKIDAKTDEVLSTDARITYDPKLLSVDSITDGTYFDIPKKDAVVPGKIYIAGIIKNPGDSKTGSGVLATITFKSLTDGTGTIGIVCNPGETAADSNIAKNELNVTDIIECTKNGSVQVTVGTGGSGSGGSGGSGGAGSGSSGGSGGSTLPRSGVIDDVLQFAVPGTMLLMFGVGLKLLL